jgi:myo-inositol 2-dehydrogenase/D-chiro-inositol 1-dehydrogenase
MKIAFYGAGPSAQPYLKALARRPDVQLTGVCDPDPRAAEFTAAGWGAKVYLSFEAMLQEAEPDALWICVAPHLHGEVVGQAVERGIPFFIEPPGAVDYAHAEVYRRRISGSKLVTTVGFTNRYADILQEAREYVGNNPVPLALGWWLDPANGDRAAGAAGLLWAEGCRLVDALRIFCGEVSRVRALATEPQTRSVSEADTPTRSASEGSEAAIPARSASEGSEAAPGLVVQLEFAGGSIGVLTCATFARPEPRVELELMGDGWSLSFADRFAALEVAERDKTTILRCLNHPAAEQVTAFLAAVRAGDPSAVAADYGDASRTLAICHAAVLSAREGRSVEFKPS